MLVLRRNHRTNRLIPSFNLVTLKLNSKSKHFSLMRDLFKRIVGTTILFQIRNPGSEVVTRFEELERCHGY